MGKFSSRLMGRFSATELKTPTWSPEQEQEKYQRWYDDWHRRHQMKPETRVELNRELAKHKVDHLPQEHPDRRRVVADWANRRVKENIAMAKMRWK